MALKLAVKMFSPKKLCLWILIAITLATLIIFMVTNFGPSQRLLISPQQCSDDSIGNAELERTFSKRKEENMNLSKEKESNEKTFSEIAISPRLWQRYPGKKWQGLQLPVLTFAPMGELGNVMSEYATLFALGHTYGVLTRMHQKMGAKLSTTFPQLSMPPIPVGPAKWKKVTMVDKFRNFAPYEVAAAGLMGPHLFSLTGTPVEIQLFNPYRKDILKEFRFSPDIQSKVESFWKENNMSRTSSVWVGFHIRRGDYIQHLQERFNAKVPEEDYYLRAMQYYRDKFPNVHFLVATDDMKFIKENLSKFEEILFTPGNVRELDMALMASCNHSIITVGTFGFWCGYLCGGEVVYADVPASQTYPLIRGRYENAKIDFFTPLSPY